MAYDLKFPLISAQFDVQTAGDKATLTIPMKGTVDRVFVVVEGTDTGGATIKFDKRPTAGSDTGRGDGDVGEITLPASDQQGKYYYEEPSSEISLKEGEQVVVQVTAEGVAALNVVAGLILSRSPETPANNTNMVAG